MDRESSQAHADYWLVDNGSTISVAIQYLLLLLPILVTHGYLPRSILTAAVSTRSADPPPPIPVRHDRPVSSAASVSINHTTAIYTNQESPQPAADPANEDAAIEANEQERVCIESSLLRCSGPVACIQIFIALYDFQSTIDGVLSLHVGERLKILRQLDDDDNEEWWYVERVDEPHQRGYVPANYIQAV